MSDLKDRAREAFPQDSVAMEALDEVFYRLRDNMKPKAVKKALQTLERYCDDLETFEGCRLPLNVTPIRGPRGDAQARASELQRAQRAERAAIIRALIGRAF